MKEILGVKRILNLLLLAAICGVLAAVVQLYFVPANEKLGQQYRVLRNNVSEKRAEASAMESDFILLEEKKAFFNNLQEAGFFSEQSRFRARQGIVDIQQHTDVISATYMISTSDVEETEVTRNSDHAVVNTKVTVNLESMDDIEIYKFAWWLENTFPGHMALTRADIVRKRDVDDDALKEISVNGPVAMVEGQLEFMWRTLVPRQELMDAGLLKPAGRF